MIRFEKTCKAYGREQSALSDIDFAIAKCEMVFLTGHSGAGKTTLLKLIL
ncbi:MAG: ATP-binding cassette domain-containing protein, partial [Gammaproteobacteria bacterium]